MGKPDTLEVGLIMGSDFLYWTHDRMLVKACQSSSSLSAAWVMYRVQSQERLLQWCQFHDFYKQVDVVIGADGANSRVAKEIDAGEYDYAIAFQVGKSFIYNQITGKGAAKDQQG